jgi:hypothetical protein
MIVNLSLLIYSSIHIISPLFYNWYSESRQYLSTIIEIPDVSRMKHYFKDSTIFQFGYICIYRILMKQNRQKRDWDLVNKERASSLHIFIIYISFGFPYHYCTMYIHIRDKQSSKIVRYGSASVTKLVNTTWKQGKSSSIVRDVQTVYIFSHIHNYF